VLFAEACTDPAAPMHRPSAIPAAPIRRIDTTALLPLLSLLLLLLVSLLNR
jgi:hypothetical protein